MAQTFTHTLATESARFAEVLARTDPDADVPTCPDWDADDLLWHLTEVHAFWARILATGAMTDDEVEAVEAAKPACPADRDAMLALFATETQALVDELRARPDDDTPAWFWLDTAQTVGSTRRMQAHEATMHRVDAELTAGAALTPLEPALAEDAVAHAFQAMWAWWGTLPGFTFAEVGVPVELAATDTGRRWLVRRAAGGAWASRARATTNPAPSSSTSPSRTPPLSSPPRWPSRRRPCREPRRNSPCGSGAAGPSPTPPAIWTPSRPCAPSGDGHAVAD